MKIEIDVEQFAKNMVAFKIQSLYQGSILK